MPRMKVTQVAVCPSEGSRKAGRPALTPELLAASGARYSRNNEGLSAILARIDPQDPERAVDSIFRMVDYGHQSIADMVPVAMFLDGVSIWLAYYLWTLCPTGGGQESSTRYLKASEEWIIPAENLGLPAPQQAEWGELINRCFQAYESALVLWEEISRDNPAVMGIPKSLLEDTSEAAQKKVKRMQRNYAFDRARYFLPASAATNVMLIMSARGWVQLCQHLLAHPLPEPRALGGLIRQELELCAPRMTRHAISTPAMQQAQEREFGKLVARAGAESGFWAQAAGPSTNAATPQLETLLPPGVSPEEFSQDLASHTNRYAPIGSGLQRVGVRFGWSAIGFAEIRDLNRHRTGTKFCPLVPQGFYFAADQLAPASDPTGERRTRLLKLAEVGQQASARAAELLRSAQPAYVYWSVLGTEYPFEHLTTADKFIYEAELRTGLGAHYRYAKHLRDVLALWYQQFPQTKGLVLEGSAEPE
jgi:thymidylate synthase ThyX